MLETAFGISLFILAGLFMSRKENDNGCAGAIIVVVVFLVIWFLLWVNKGITY